MTFAQAQQSAFQGTWIGERQPVDRSQYRIEISGNNWTSFFRNEIEAGGTARFSPGQAELRLANGQVYWDLTLLAPGIMEQPISRWDGYYRFRLQSSNNSQNNSQSNTQNISTITILNNTGYPGDAFWIRRAGSDDCDSKVSVMV